MTIQKEGRKVFVSYLEDDGTSKSGIFELVKENEGSVKIKSGKNIITIPFHRLNKMKEAIE